MRSSKSHKDQKSWNEFVFNKHMLAIYCAFFKNIYLFILEGEQERACILVEGGAEGKNPKLTALSTEPNLGLNPTTLRS